MNAEIIAVGTEILLGDITNTHARYLARELAALGINLLHQSVVGDNGKRLSAALEEALERSDLVILTGGLGPTNDDLTKETVCRVMGVELMPDEEALTRMEAYFSRTGREMPQNNKKQALVPADSTVFYNDYGTAPGAAVEKDGKCVIMLPGPPRELIPMFEGKVRPFLKKYSDGVIASHTLMATGIGESAVAEKLGGLLESTSPTAALYAKDGEVQIRVTAKAKNKAEAEQAAAPMIGEIRRRLGDFVYGMDVPNLHSVVVGLLREQKLMIATAESCTGGMLSQRLTEISGASEVFEFGVASYSNRIKEKALGIPREILERCGAVSSEVAMLMAAGAQREGGADIGVGITGIAGPGGGTPDTPVGRVFVAVTYHHKYWVEKLSIGHGEADERDYIRSIATLHALNMVRLILEGSPRAVMALADLPQLPVASAAAAAVIDPDQTGNDENPDTAADDIAAEKQDGPKPPWYKRLVRYLIPWKGDAPSEIVRKVIFLVALVTLIGSSIYIIDYINAHVQSDLVHNETISLYNKQPTEEELAQLPEGYLEKFAALYSKNSDIKGWITIPNSRVNHPVVMTTDNAYYLDHDFDKNENRYGVPFIDWRCRFGRAEDGTTELSTNTILYGHNGAGGKIFCDAKNYYSSFTFYKSSPVITFDTVYEEAQWKVIAAFLTNGSNDGDGYYFDYHNFIEAESQEHFDWFIRQIKRRSVINVIDTGAVDVQYGDELLTLSTCSRKADLNDGRVVVVARKVREGESASVDVSKVTKNENPLYPNAWYKQHGKAVPTWPEEWVNDTNPSENTDQSAVPGGDSDDDGSSSSRIPDDSTVVIPSRPRPNTSATQSSGNTTSAGSTSSTASGGTTTSTPSSTTDPGGGDQSSEPGGGDQSSEPGGGDQSSEPGGGDQSSEPGGGDQSSEPGGGDQSSEPGGGDQSSEPGGGDQSSEPGSGEDTPEPQEEPIQPEQ